MSRKKRGLMEWGGDERGWIDHQIGEHNNHIHPSAKKGWNTGDAPQVCKDCSFLGERKQVIHVQYEVWKTLMALCSTVKVEWQALLSGTIDADGKVIITGYYIPKQEVSASTVKNLDIIDDEFIAKHHIVAGVHSHGSMPCFFSVTDVEHTNMSLIKHNIVVNNKREYKAESRVELPCGLVKFIEADVYTIGEPEAEIVGVEKIVEKKWGFTPTAYTPRTTKSTDIENGHRWCPTCNFKPEEDNGSCTCWTRQERLMLPDFTTEFYVKSFIHGNTWELKPELELKYKQGGGVTKE